MSWLNPRDLFWYENAQGGTDPIPITEHRSQLVVLPGKTTLRINHLLGTATNVAPAFNPSWNCQVWVRELTSTYVDVGFSVPSPAPPTGAMLDYSLCRTGNVQSVSGQTATVTHNLGDATKVILFAPTWNTIVRVTSKAANSMTVQFSTVAPANAQLYWAQHTEPLDSALNAQSASTQVHTFTHDLGHAFAPTFYVPYWNTAVRSRDKGLTTTTVVFSVPPSGSLNFDALVKSP